MKMLNRSASARITLAAVDDPNKEVQKAMQLASLARAKSNSQLLQEKFNDDPDSTTEAFIEKLKSTEQETPTSSFRARRLSMAQKLDPNASDASAAVEMKSSVYTATEMGEELVHGPPFRSESLGTYSCHGIEPSGDGVVSKINQDRGCLVYPFNLSYEEYLFLVLDGHGEQGDLVSEFVMQQVDIFYALYL